MNKIISFITLLIIATASFSQQADPSLVLTQEEYLKKSKKQKTEAWAFLVGGTLLVGTGFLIGDGNGDSFDHLIGANVLIAGIGVLSTLVSIPLFVASAKNKRLGMKASAHVKMENVYAIRESGVVQTLSPTFSVRINLH
jgi:hypothetical protein